MRGTKWRGESIVGQCSFFAIFVVLCLSSRNGRHMGGRAKPKSIDHSFVFYFFFAAAVSGSLPDRYKTIAISLLFAFLFLISFSTFHRQNRKKNKHHQLQPLATTSPPYRQTLQPLQSSTFTTWSLSPNTTTTTNNNKPTR